MKKFSNTIILLFFCITLFSCSSKPKKLFLWKTMIGKSSVYLLGSIHMAPETIYPLHKKIRVALQQADTVVLETIINKKERIKIEQKIMQKIMFENSKNLRESIPNELHKNLIKKCKDLGIDHAIYEMLPPLWAALILEVTIFNQYGFDAKYGIDTKIEELAKKQKKKILGLESVSFQLSLLNMPPKVGIALLKSTLNELNSKSIKAFLEFWQTGGFRDMQKILLKDSYNPDLKPFYKKIVFDRNITMTKKIIRFAKRDKKKLFVVVGAGHLIGPKSIISLLRKKGYKTQQIVQ